MSSSFALRAKCLILMLCVLYSALVAQFFHLQVIHGDYWRAIALKQHTLTIREPGRRGRFFTDGSVKLDHLNEDAVLAMDSPRFHLHIDPQSMPKMAHLIVANYLAEQLCPYGEKREKLRVKIIDQMKRKARDRILAEWIDPETRTRIESWWLGFHRKGKIARNALFFTRDYQRVYPLGPLMGSVLQTVRRQRADVTGPIPIGGLELSFDRYLRGKTGTRKLLRSLKNPMETGITTVSTEPGADVYLTINHVLQAIAEEELEIGARRCGARGGWAVLLDPWSGHILALAQFPNFDLNHYWKYFNSPEEGATRSKAFCDAYEPGSILKPLHLAIALTANEQLRAQGTPPLFDPEEKVATIDGHFPGRTRPLRDVGQRNFHNMDLAVQKSSNIYMAKVAVNIVEQMGKKWYRDQFLRLGFEDKSGINLPGEAAGSIPQLQPGNNGKVVKWSLPTTTSLSLGHSIQLNAIQIARAYCALANGGRLVWPKLIKGIARTTEDGKRAWVEQTSSPNPPQVFSPEVARRILQSMRFVTQPGGSGYRAAIADWEVCGKTGTSEKVIAGRYSKQRMLSSFIGIAPVKNPRFVLLVSLDEPTWGNVGDVALNHRAGICAAPIFREIARRALCYLSVPMSDPSKEFPNNQKLRELDKKWNQK